MTQFKAEAEAAFKESKKHADKLAKFLELVTKQAKDEIELGEYEAHSAIADELKNSMTEMRAKLASMQAVATQAKRAQKKKGG